MKQEKEKKGLPFFGIPKLAPYLKPYKMLFFWMVVTGTVGSGMDAIIPLFQQHAIDHFIADKTMQLSLFPICRCRRYAVCRGRWSPLH